MIGEIAGKLADAAHMFWLALSDEERRLLVGGIVYLAATMAFSSMERRRKQAEQDNLVELVVQRLEGVRHGG